MLITRYAWLDMSREDKSDQNFTIVCGHTKEKHTQQSDLFILVSPGCETT